MTLSGATAYKAVVLANSPTYYWLINENSGTAVTDYGGASNTGTYNGSITLNQSQSTITAAGSPAIAWGVNSAQLAQFQSLQGRVPLSLGSMASATPVSGTGGGSVGGAGGGGGGGCFTGDVLVKTNNGNTQFDQLKTGDFVLTAAGTYRPILKLHVIDWDGEMFRLPNGGLITPNHPVLHDGNWLHAQKVFSDSVSFAGKVYNLTVSTEEDWDSEDSASIEKSYVLSCGVIAHNVQASRS